MSLSPHSSHCPFLLSSHPCWFKLLSELLSPTGTSTFHSQHSSEDAKLPSRRLWRKSPASCCGNNRNHSTYPRLLFPLLFFGACPCLWNPRPAASSAAQCKHTLLCAACLSTEPGERGQELLLDQLLPAHVAQVEPVIYLICTATIISFWNQPHETAVNKRVTFGGEFLIVLRQKKFSFSATLAITQ